MKGWQPCTYDPDTKPSCAGMTAGEVAPPRGRQGRPAAPTDDLDPNSLADSY